MSSQEERETPGHGHTKTFLQSFEGKHYWTISNWMSYINCSTAAATLYSDVFTVLTVDGKATRWQIKAYPKQSSNGHQYLAFKLICLDEETPLGSFHFVTYTQGWFWGLKPYFRFGLLPLDAASHCSTCVRLHPSNDLTICVKITIVVNSSDRPAAQNAEYLPLYETVANAPPNPYLTNSEDGATMPILQEEEEEATASTGKEASGEKVYTGDILEPVDNIAYDC